VEKGGGGLAQLVRINTRTWARRPRITQWGTKKICVLTPAERKIGVDKERNTKEFSESSLCDLQKNGETGGST